MTSDTPTDLTRLHTAPTASGELRALTEACEEMLAMQEGIRAAEEVLKNLKSQEEEVRSKRIPDMMSEVGLTQLALENGIVIRIKQLIRGHISKDRATEAFAWLESHGHGALIKADVVAKFGRGDRAAALDLVRDLEASGLTVSFRESVHHQTLGAFLREQLNKGNPVDMDLLGVWIGREAKVERP